MLTGTISCRIRGFHPLWQAFPGLCAGNGFGNPSVLPQPRSEDRFGLVPLSLAATDGIDVSFFPAGTEMFQFPAFALLTLYIQVRVTAGYAAEFPHSEILGSTLVASFPRHIAGYHVFVASQCQDIHPAPFVA